MRGSVRFTDTFIKNLKPEKKKYYKREAAGFTIRVLTSGVKTWLYVYTFQGTRKEMNLGHYPHVTLSDARTKYNAAFEVWKLGRDPAAEEREQEEAKRNAPTVNNLIKEYMNRHAKVFKKSWKKDEEILDRDVVPLWGKRKAEDIKKRDVVSLLDGIVDRGSPGMANNAFQIIRKMFNFAVEKDILPHSPCAGMKLPSPKNSRTRILGDVEILQFWRKLDSKPLRMSEEVIGILKLLLITAQRENEVAGMHTREINDRWWTIPPERAKNKVEHRIYLTDMALEIIGDTEKPRYIFPSPDVKRRGESPVHGEAVCAAVLKNFKFKEKDEKGNVSERNLWAMEDFKPHDLRRTVSTALGEMDFMDEHIDAVLNHVKKGVIRTYNLAKYNRPKQMALEAWERKLAGILKQKQGANVIPMVRKENR